MSTTPNSILGAAAPGVSRNDDLTPGHTVQFYSSDDFLLESLGEFLGNALDAGGAAVVVATAAHRAGLADGLATRGINLAMVESQNRYLALDASDTLTKISLDGMPNSERFFDLIGSVLGRAENAGGNAERPIAVFGEMVALLWAEGKTEAAISLEQLWNDLGKKRSFSLRCSYPIQGFGEDLHSEAFSRICGEHHQVIPGESYSALTSNGDRLRNISQLQQKAQALETEKRQRQNAEKSLELVENANRSLHELSAQLLQLQDNERRRIAHDLRETTGQELALLSMNLSALEPEASQFSSDLAHKLNHAGEIARRASAQLRDLSYLLYPPLLEEMGLASALRWHIERFCERSGVPASWELPSNLARLSPELEVALFRVVQDCLAYGEQPPVASRALVRLSLNCGNVVLMVEDERDREDVPEKLRETEPLFLRCTRERVQDLGGKLTIESHTKGTTIKVVIPWITPDTTVASK